MANDMKVPLANEDIEVFHRLSTREKAGIIVKFASRPIAERFLANKRGLRTKTVRDYEYVLEDNNDKGWIFVNESLTKMNKDLFKKVRKQCKDKNYHCAWTKNGNVSVRKDADSSIIRIATEEELCKKVK